MLPRWVVHVIGGTLVAYVVGVTVWLFATDTALGGWYFPVFLPLWLAPLVVPRLVEPVSRQTHVSGAVDAVREQVRRAVVRLGADDARVEGEALRFRHRPEQALGGAIDLAVRLDRDSQSGRVVLVTARQRYGVWDLGRPRRAAERLVAEIERTA